MKRLTAPLLLGAVSLLLFIGCQKSPPVEEHLAGSSSPAHTRFQDPLSKGLWSLYHLQYSDARQIFDDYIKSHPKDPSGYFYRTAVDWWQLAQNFEIDQKDIVLQFEKDSRETLRVAEAMERSQDLSEQARALFYQGGAWGLRGRFEVTQHQWLDAYRSGKRGRSDLARSLEIDPSLEDAYLGLGIYDYYADTLHGVQAFLSTLLIHGDRKRGLSEIKRALHKGQRSRVEASLFLIDIYTSTEEQPKEALKLAQQLYSDFPQSPAMHLAVISTLGATRDWAHMNSESEHFLDRIQKHAPFYTHDHLPAGLYYCGLAALRQQDAATALKRMKEILALRDLPRESRWTSFAYLREGEAYALQGDPDRARADFRRVLSRADVWGSHREASALLAAKPLKS